MVGSNMESLGGKTNVVATGLEICEVHCNILQLVQRFFRTQTA